MFHQEFETLEAASTVSRGETETCMAPIVILCIVCFFAVILVGSLLAYRHKREELAHKERIAAIEKGVPYPLDLQAEPTTPLRRYLLAGMIWLFSGAALLIFLGGLAATTLHHSSLPMQERQARIDELRKLGAPDWELRNVYYDHRDPEIPFGLALVGLIPMGVGVAYLIFFFSERKRVSV
jgi:hypothetical protein